jgi:hypothetical protein
VITATRRGSSVGAASPVPEFYLFRPLDGFGSVLRLRLHELRGGPPDLAAIFGRAGCQKSASNLNSRSRTRLRFFLAFRIRRSHVLDRDRCPTYVGKRVVQAASPTSRRSSFAS